MNQDNMPSYTQYKVTSFPFALVHLNFQQAFGTLGIRLILAYVAYVYSFKTGLLLHILNNFRAFLLVKLMKTYGLESLPLIILVGVLILIILYSLISLFSKQRRQEIKKNLGNPRENSDIYKFEIQA